MERLKIGPEAITGISSKLKIAPNVGTTETSLGYDASIQIDGATYSWLSGDASFVYASGAGGSGDLDVYSYNGSVFTYESSVNTPGVIFHGTYRTSDFLFAGNNFGVYSYSVDGAGNLTEIDTTATIGTCEDVVYDGNFLYVTSRDGDVSTGVIVYSVDASGFMTYESSIGGISKGTGYGIDADGSGGVIDLDNKNLIVYL